MAGRSRVVRVEIVGDSRNVHQAFSQLQKVSGSLLGSFGKLAGTAGLVGVAVQMKRLATAAINLAGDFETSMAKIVGLVGLSREQVEAWKDDLLAMAPEVGKSPTELAEALFFITSAGVRGSEALDVLRESAKAASAGLGETKDVAFAAVSALNAYGMENLSAKQAVDILTMTVREGNVAADTVASSLGAVIPLASELGVSFDQVGASIAAMTRLGLDASKATTALRAIMTTLLRPSSMAEATLTRFGLSAAGLREQLREKGLLSVLTTLREKFGDNETAMAQVFRNVRGLTGVLNLVGNNAASAAVIFDNLANSTGTTDEAFAAIAETADFKLTQAMTKLQVIGVEVGGRVLPAIVQIVEAARPVVEVLGSAFQSLAGVMAILGPVVAGIAKALGAILGVFGPFIAVVLTAVVANRALTVAFQAMRLVMIKIQFGTLQSSIMNFMKGGVGPLTIGIGLAVTVFSAWNKAKKEAKERAEALAATLDDETGAVTDNTRAWVENKLVELGVLENFTKAGLSITTVTDAVMGNAEAMATVQANMDKTGLSGQALVTVYGMLFATGQDAMEVQRQKAEADALEAREANAATVATQAHEEALRRIIQMYPDTAAGAAAVAEITGDLTTIDGELGDASDALADDLDEEAEAAETLAEQLAEAEEAHTSIAAIVRAAAGPADTAASAISRLGTAHTALDAAMTTVGTTSSEVAQAQLDYALASAEAQAAIDAIGESAGGLGDVLYSLRLATGLSRDEVVLLLTQLGILDANTGELVTDIPELGEALEDAVVPTTELAEETKSLADRLAEAEIAQKSLSDVLRAAADPVFAASSAVQGMRQAERDLAEVMGDAEATMDEKAQAQLDYASATLEAQSALDALASSPMGVEEGIRALMTATGLSRQAVIDLLNTLGILDGQRINAVLGITAPIISYSQQKDAEGNIFLRPGEAGHVAFAKGGIGRGRSGGLLATIAEGGSDEAVIPLNERGMTFLIEALTRAIGRGQSITQETRPAPPQTITVVIELDGREIGRAVEVPVLDRIRLRAGIRR